MSEVEKAEVETANARLAPRCRVSGKVLGSPSITGLIMVCYNDYDYLLHVWIATAAGRCADVATLQRHVCSLQIPHRQIVGSTCCIPD